MNPCPLQCIFLCLIGLVFQLFLQVQLRPLLFQSFLALMRFFLAIVVNAARIRYKDFETADEAVAFLRAHDPALPEFGALIGTAA